MTVSEVKGRWHTCSVCGHQGPWTDAHQWYGRITDLDGGSPRHPARPIVVTCSDLCRGNAIARGLVPADAELIR